jgi:DNA-binding MarR family transcriptional regulator
MARAQRTPEQERARRALWAVVQRVRACLKEAYAAHGLTVPQGFTLKTLAEEGPSNAGAVAACLGVSPGTLTGILDRLEELGYVQRARAPDDRRAVRVALTAKGQRLLRDLDAVQAAALDEGFGRLDAAELGQFVALLEKMQGSEAPLPPMRKRA